MQACQKTVAVLLPLSILYADVCLVLCHGAIVLVEQGNIYRPTSYYHKTEFQFCDIMMAHGHRRHPKFVVLLSLIMGRRFSRHQRPHILSGIIHGVALYAGICGMSTC